MPVPVPILMSRLAGPGDAQAYARAAGLPATHNGRRAVYGWCEAARVGTFQTAGGRRVMLSRGDLDDLADRCRRMVKAGVNIPVVRDGREMSDDVLGYVLHAERNGDALHALSMFIGQDSADEAKGCRFGAGLDRDFRDSRGERYGRAMRHLAARHATTTELSAAQAWRDGGPSPRNPLLDLANSMNPTRAPSVMLSAALPAEHESAEQALGRIWGLSRSGPPDVEFLEPL